MITRPSIALVQHDAPELEKRCRPHLKACNDSWKGDETSINVKKVWTSLSRAVDSEGNTLAFLLSATRDAEAAKRFFLKALGASARPFGSPGKSHREESGSVACTAAFKAKNAAPRVINVEKNAAYPQAIVELKASGILPALVELTSASTTRKNLIEQDHRAHQTPGQARHGLLFLRHGMENITGI